MRKCARGSARPNATAHGGSVRATISPTRPVGSQQGRHRPLLRHGGESRSKRFIRFPAPSLQRATPDKQFATCSRRLPCCRPRPDVGPRRSLLR
eukprot:435558-Alexandrium_andersonii.AAC.1